MGYDHTVVDNEYWWVYVKNSATSWCQDFLSSMTCTSTGLITPEFKDGYSWDTVKASYSTSFDALDPYAKNTISGAVADAEGTDIQEAVRRYDLIVANHGFVKFIKNSSSVLRSAASPKLVSTVVNSGNDSAGIMVITVSTLAFLAIASYCFFTHKRKED